ncbi:MAG: hypothetical protein WC373_08505 [Smithella sp.]|jgi:hypothetical protein
MKKRILVEQEIDVDDTEPECCGECERLTTVGYFHNDSCDLFLENGVYVPIGMSSRFRCEQCLAAKEVEG